MIIKNILIITVIAALVPTAMSNVSASAGSEIALFSGVSDSDGLSISGNGDTAKMELKATNDDGKSNKISDFQLTADNVLSAEVGDKVTVLDNVDFTKAVTTDARNNQKAIGITSNGMIDFAAYNQGVYTLDVVVDDDRAYEAIIAIGDQTNQIVDKEITRVNSDYTIKFVIDPQDCGKGYHLENGKCVPDDPCDPKSDPKCDDPCDPKSDPKCDDPCDPKSDPKCDDPCEFDPKCIDPPYTEPPITPEPVPCSIDPTGSDCETPEPITPEPEPITPEPGDPVDPCSIESTDCETPDEPVVLPLVSENTVEVPNEPIEEFLNYEELGEDSGNDYSEGSEDSGGSDSEGSEDSGGSDGETSE